MCCHHSRRKAPIGWVSEDGGEGDLERIGLRLRVEVDGGLSVWFAELLGPNSARVGEHDRKRDCR